MLSIGVREMAAAIRVLSKGDLSRFSERGTSETRRFEMELASKFGARHALAVNSGTSALISALVGIGVGPGDEVLVPAYTWVSTAAAPLAVGAVPVLVEIDETLTIDPNDIRRKVSPRTKAIIPVHMLNLVCDMKAIMEIADEHGISVIEDACQAFGLEYGGRRLGTIGHAGVYSFNQHKNIKSGEGGALVTNDDRIFARAAMYHDVGSYERSDKFQSDEPLLVGVNFRMPELSAAILRTQLRRLDKQLQVRRKRRAQVVRRMRLHEVQGAQLNPHNDEAHAAAVAVLFDRAERANEFGNARGARRLIDTGRHVYTNWQSLVAMRTYHPGFDPWQWSGVVPDFSPQACPRTLDVLSRSCAIELAPEVPGLAYRFLSKGIVESRSIRRGAAAAS